MPRIFKISSFVIQAVVLGTFFCSAFVAEAEDKVEAINSALSEIEALRQPVVPPAETSHISEYRQKLSTEVGKEDTVITHEVDSYVRFMPTRSLTAQPGKVSLSKAAFEYSYSFKAFDELPIELGLMSENIDINASDAVPVSLPAHLTGLAFSAETTLPFFNLDRIYMRLGISPAFYSSNWNFKSNSFNFGSRAFMIYEYNDKWTFVAGMALYPGFESPVVPIAGVIYKPNDKLTFNLVPERPTISYKFNEAVTVFTEGGLSGGEFKVTKDRVKGAALAYNETHLGAGVKVKVNKYIDATFSMGRMFNHYLQYRDSLGKVDMKNNTYSELRVEMKI